MAIRDQGCGPSRNTDDHQRKYGRRQRRDVRRDGRNCALAFPRCLVGRSRRRVVSSGSREYIQGQQRRFESIAVLVVARDELRSKQPTRSRGARLCRVRATKQRSAATKNRAAAAAVAVAAAACVSLLTEGFLLLRLTIMPQAQPCGCPPWPPRRARWRPRGPRGPPQRRLAGLQPRFPRSPRRERSGLGLRGRAPQVYTSC